MRAWYNAKITKYCTSGKQKINTLDEIELQLKLFYSKKKNETNCYLPFNFLSPIHSLCSIIYVRKISPAQRHMCGQTTDRDTASSSGKGDTCLNVSSRNASGRWGCQCMDPQTYIFPYSFCPRWTQYIFISNLATSLIVSHALIFPWYIKQPKLSY